MSVCFILADISKCYLNNVREYVDAIYSPLVSGGAELDGIPCISVEDLLNCKFDYYVINCSENELSEWIKILVRMGIDEDVIVQQKVFDINNFDIEKYLRLKKSHPSLITHHCWGGYTYHTLGMKFLSPFINMFMQPEDYLKLISDFPSYMEAEPVYLRNGYETNLKREYPIASLKDIEIYMNHYVEFESAKATFDERKKRLNYNNLIFEFTSNDEKLIEKFAGLPLKKKILFTETDCDYDFAVDLRRCIGNEHVQPLPNQSNQYGGNLGIGYNPINLLLGEGEKYRLKIPN